MLPLLIRHHIADMMYMQASTYYKIVLYLPEMLDLAPRRLLNYPTS